ncbi:MAG: ABC transporter permease [Bacteroidales bacterium]|nr:MAG: ABC transporter permease [Bacteroidales bacterium]
MIRHFLITVIRDFGRNRLISLINLCGLAIALGSSFLILNYVLHENRYNRFHLNKERICRVLSAYNWGQNEWELMSSSSLILGDILKEEYPDVEFVTRISNYDYFYGGQYIKKEETYIHEPRFMMVDPSFFDIFSYEILQGNRSDLIQDPYDILVSESMAEKYFSDEYPVGKTLTVRNYEGEKIYTVKGVFRDIPTYSTFQADFIGNMERTLSFFGDRGWNLSNIETYFLLRSRESIQILQDKLIDFYKLRHPDQEIRYYLQPLTRIYFHSDHLVWYQLPQGNLKRIYVLSSIALLILIIPSINYVILAIGRGMNRYLEIGMKKTLGATRKSIFIQITFESVIFLFLALPFALMFSELLLPTFNRLINTDLKIEYLGNWLYLTGLFLITFLLGYLSGSYISFYISRFQPEEILKSRFTSRYGGRNVRRFLILVQLCIFLVLFVFSIILFKQIKFIERKNLGFNPENIIAIVPPHDHTLYSCKSFADAIRTLPGIEAVTEVQAGIFTAVYYRIELIPEGKQDETVLTRAFTADPHFIETFNLNIIEGRGLSPFFATDSGRVLINETARQELGLKNPLGKIITSKSGTDYEIIGLLSDFNIESLHNKIPPLVVMIRPARTMVSQIAVRLNDKADPESRLSILEDYWETHGPGGRFEFFFLDQEYGSLYEDDRRFAKTIGLFALLAIFVATLGLFSFSVFMSFQRTKEVGIRKSFGAQPITIIWLIIKEYIFLVILANVISWPLGWFLASKWLNNFAYKTNIGFTIFLAAAVISAFVILITVGYNTKRLTGLNPVDSLRYE